MKRFIFSILISLLSFSSFAAENLQLLISPEAIAKEIQFTAAKIEQDYNGEPLTVVMVMKSAICITADLMRALNLPTKLEYIQAFSVRKGEEGSVKISGI